MDLKGFKNSVLPIKDKLFRIALGLLKSIEESEDILQDTMMKLWHNRQRWSDYKNFEAYAVTITKNMCLDKLKSKKLYGGEDVQHLQIDNGALSPYHRLENNDNLTTMKLAFGQLSEQQRLLVTLRDVEGYTYEEIATITGLEINNIRVGISRARKRAKEEYLKIMSYGN